MAYISLDNVVEYQYPKLKKSSKLPLIPYGASSFQSTTEPFLNHSSSVDVYATVLPPASASENLFSFANINSMITQTQIQIEECCPPPAAALIDSDASDEKGKDKDHNIWDQKIDQAACRNSNEKTHDNHYTEKNKDLSEHLETTEISLDEDVPVTRSPDGGISLLLSDGEIERDSSTIPESFVEQMPSTVLDDSVASMVQASATGMNRISRSLFINTPIVDPMCLDTLADTDSGQSIYQNSPINEAAEAQSVPIQTQSLNHSQIPRQKLIGHLEENPQRRKSSVGEPYKSLSVVVPRRSVRTSKSSRTGRHLRFTPRTESDDSGDTDYRESSHVESPMEDGEPSARPAKRQRRGDTGMDTSQLHRERLREQAYSTSSPLRLSSPESMLQSSTSPETVRIQGQFLRKVSLSRVEYCFWVTEDQNSTAIKPALFDMWASFKKLTNAGVQSTGMSDFHAINIEGLFTRELKPCGYIWSCNFKEKHTKSLDHHTSSQEGRLSPSPDGLEEDDQVSQRVDKSAKSVSSKGKEYTNEEDELIVTLKEIEKLPWSSVAAHFPGRTKTALQVRYCTVLKKHKKRKASQTKVAEVETEQNTESSGRRYSLRRSRRSPGRYVPGS